VRDRRSYRDYLRDMVQAAADAIVFTQGMDFSIFSGDRRTNLAVVRALEIIGEAARQVPTDVRRRYPQVPWQDMADMRNKLIHEYFGVDLEVVWRTVQEDLPQLVGAVQQILVEMEGEAGDHPARPGG
jgi:uncharacterized protein with HEPN domain